MKIKFLCFLTFVLIFTTTVNAQQVRMNPFVVKSSNLIEELKAAKASNPKIGAEDFVKTANALLETKGLNFTFAFDAATCQKIESAKASRKDANAPLNLRTAIKSITGEAAALQLPEPRFGKPECFACYVSIPILQITNAEFVTIIDNKNVGFFMPANFAVSEVSLVDNSDLATVKQKWKVPSRMKPVSISEDGKILYLEFNEPELKDLVLLAFSEGVFQFAARKELDANLKAEAVKTIPPAAQTPNHSFVKFVKDKTAQTVKFPVDCAN
jgi:hypothetical protein